MFARASSRHASLRPIDTSRLVRRQRHRGGHARPDRAGQRYPNTVQVMVFLLPRCMAHQERARPSYTYYMSELSFTSNGDVRSLFCARLRHAPIYAPSE